MASYGKRYKCSIKCSSNSNFRINTGVLADYAGVRFPPSPPNARYTNTTSRISLAVYRNVFALIVEIDGYEGETRLQTKRATYKDIQAWVKERYGIQSAISPYPRPRNSAALPRRSIRAMEMPKGMLPSWPQRKRRLSARRSFGSA